MVHIQAAYYSSKFALCGMTECWRAELRQHNIRVFLVNPSEVPTNFGAAAGHPQKDNPTKLREDGIADQGCAGNERSRLPSGTVDLRNQSGGSGTDPLPGEIGYSTMAG
jgi:NAD(P)-dependent dehydrogenase (short-subunit alcohol dehydrogenase family)